MIESNQEDFIVVKLEDSSLDDDYLSFVMVSTKDNLLFIPAAAVGDESEVAGLAMDAGCSAVRNMDHWYIEADWAAEMLPALKMLSNIIKKRLATAGIVVNDHTNSD